MTRGCDSARPCSDDAGVKTRDQTQERTRQSTTATVAVESDILLTDVVQLVRGSCWVVQLMIGAGARSCGVVVLSRPVRVALLQVHRVLCVRVCVCACVRACVCACGGERENCVLKHRTLNHQDAVINPYENVYSIKLTAQARERTYALGSHAMLIESECRRAWGHRRHRRSCALM